ncbi:Oligopeptide-binding protein OppA [subsurface metagenome]
MKRNILILILALSLIMGFSLVTLTAPVTLRWNLDSEPPTLDPALAHDTTSLLVIGEIFLGLTNYDSEIGEIIPELAESWSVSDDGLKWTFQIRKGVVWTDGTPITAHDVVYSMLRMLAPETAASPANLLWVVKGAEPYNLGRGPVEDVGIKAVGDYTVEFTLEHPVGFFSALASRVCVTVPQQSIEEYGDKWIEPENIVTNGPYKVSEWKHEDYLVLEKNPNYYNASHVNIDKIYCSIIVEASTAMAEYEVGNLDCFRNIPLEDLDRIKDDPILSKELHVTARWGTYFYGFNNEKPPFDNLLVRKAFASAVDRESLIEFVLKGGQGVAQTFVSPGIPGYVDGVKEGVGYPYDPEVARKYLAEAGYPKGEGLPEVTLMFNTSESHRKIAQAVQQMWKEVLGVEVNITNQEWKVYLNTLQHDAPQIFRLGWMASYPDGYDYLKRNFYSTVPENNAGYKSLEFDSAVDELERETDPVKRMEAFRKAETLLCDTDCAIVPIYYYTMEELAKPYVVRNFIPTINDVPHFKDWKIVK